MKPDIEAIRERAEKATEGPWVSIADVRPSVTVINPQNEYAERGYIGYGNLLFLNKYTGNMNDANFIAHARTDIPDLLAYIAELEAVAEAARDVRIKIIKQSGQDCKGYEKCARCKFVNPVCYLKPVGIALYKLNVIPNE